MRKFETVTSIPCPFVRNNVDTDMIIPARFMKTIKRSGLGGHVFEDIRLQPDGTRNPNLPFDKPAFQESKILITGANFGCGSSREHAPWALKDWGFKVIIAESFADIFQSNCLKNGILPISLPRRQVERFSQTAEQGQRLTVCLKRKQIANECGETVAFAMNEAARKCLLEGLDDIAITLASLDVIKAYEAKRFKEQPWIVPKKESVI